MVTPPPGLESSLDRVRTRRRCSAGEDEPENELDEESAGSGLVVTFGNVGDSLGKGSRGG